MSAPLDPNRRGTQPLQLPPNTPRPAAPPPQAPPARGTGQLPPQEHHWWQGITGELHHALDAVSDVAKGAIDAAGNLAEHELERLGDVAGAAVTKVAGQHAGRAVQHAVADAGHTVGSTAHDVASTVQRVGHLAGEAVEDPIGVARREALHVLDGALGKPLRQYEHEQVPGMIGEITRRLPPGHGAYASVGGGATFPSETVATVLSLGMGGEAIPDVSLDMRATGAVERTPDGKIRVVVSMRTDESASWNAGVGFDTGIEHNGRTVLGAHVGAEATAAVTASQMAQVELTFDPNNPQDAARLGQLFGTSTIPPGANVNPAALAEAYRTNGQSVTVGGALAGRLTGHLEANATAAGQTVGAEANGALGAGVTGLTRTNRDGSRVTTGYVSLDVSAGAGGSIPLMEPASVDLVRGAMRAATGTDATVNDMADLQVAQDPDGSLRSVAFEVTHVDARGHTVELDDGNGGVNRRDATAAYTATRIELTPQGMRALQAMGAPTPDRVARLLADPANYRTTTQDASANGTSYGGHFTANLGIGKVDLHGDVGVGMYQVQGGDDPDLVHRNILTGGGR